MATRPMKQISGLPGLEGNTYTFVQLDDTLTTAGKAADAKKTGDELNDLKSASDNLVTLLDAEGKNLLNPVWLANCVRGNDPLYTLDGDSVTVEWRDYSTVASTDRILKLDAGVYTISFQNSSRCIVLANGSKIADFTGTSKNFTVSADNSNIFIRFLPSSYPYNLGHIQIEKGNAATAYEPYGLFLESKRLESDENDIDSIHTTLKFRSYNYFNPEWLENNDHFSVDSNDRITVLYADTTADANVPGFMTLPAGEYCISFENRVNRLILYNATDHTKIIDKYNITDSVFTLSDSTLIGMKIFSGSYPFACGHIQIEAGNTPTAWQSYNRFAVCDALTQRILVTQTDIVNSVQKQVIESTIEEVQTGRNASLYGVLPSNSGATNKTNLQTLLNQGGRIIVDVPGIYEMDGRLIVHSNTELLFGEGVYIKRTESNDALLVNYGATVREFDTDITIDGMNLICDGKNGAPWNSISGMRGQLTFHYIKNLTIRNFTCEDNPDGPYLLHFNRWENVLVENVRIVGIKDALHFNTGKNLIVRNAHIDVVDDCIALNAQDYPTGTADLGWIENVTLENIYNEAKRETRPYGYVIRLIAGSWADWASGNMYRFSDTIVAPNGCVYRLVGPDTTATEHESTVAPTIQAGRETTSDGLQWRFIQNYTKYNCAIKNLVIKNLYCERERDCIICIANEDSAYNRGVYPGTVPPLHQNIVLDNISVSGNVGTLVAVQMGFEELKLINSNLNFEKVIDDYASYDTKSIVALSNNTYRNESNFVLASATRQHQIKLQKVLDIVVNSDVVGAISGNIVVI